ncbi:hypothetical protein [Alcanivorax sp. DP30]|uniref:hypothetical protein n=1 Tax=Alcanivorax sp. DP30 TaxID=2606217 RepID=UPI00136EBECA|nr:hypothetical protein [Alcanivorax sp. DP30]MZR62911.1 hypothetical protein [Alcanivorax sp. DP30]
MNSLQARNAKAEKGDGDAGLSILCRACRTGGGIELHNALAYVREEKYPVTS